MAWKDLEAELHEAIQRCCQTKEDETAAKKYFAETTVDELIDDALEE